MKWEKLKALYWRFDAWALRHILRYDVALVEEYRRWKLRNGLLASGGKIAIVDDVTGESLRDLPDIQSVWDEICDERGWPRRPVQYL